MKLKYIFVPFFLIFTGCVQVQYNGGTKAIESVDYPKLETENVAYVGDYLLQKGTIYKVKTLKVNKPIDGILYQIPSINYFPLGNDNQYLFFEAQAVTKSALADPIKALALENNSNNLCIVTVYNDTSCYNNVDAELETRIAEKSNSFQQTLIYSGKIGNKINISYREFSDNSARPAFNNDVEYDLSESDIIGYKGALIKVIKADNRSITYKVINNFR